MGSRCLFVTLVSGRSRDPRPPARMIPFMFLLAVRVLALVIGSEFAGLDGAPPGVVFAVPGDRLCEAFFEADARTPAECLRFVTVQGVAPVMTGTVLAVADALLERAAGEVEQPLGDLEVRAAVAPADVVDFARRAVLQH